jgi:hypothetical protein
MELEPGQGWRQGYGQEDCGIHEGNEKMRIEGKSALKKKRGRNTTLTSMKEKGRLTRPTADPRAQ